MTQGKVKAVIFIIIGILIVAILCSWLAGKDNNKGDSVVASDISNVSGTGNTGADSLASTPAPGENAPAVPGTTSPIIINGSGNAVSNTTSGGTTTTTGDSSASGGTTTTDNGSQTQESTTTEEGQTEAEPEATPVNTVPFVARTLNSTSFVSDDAAGGLLTLRADVTAETYSDTEVLVTVNLSVQSYSLYLTGNPEGAGVQVNGVYTTVATPTVEKPDNSRSETPLGKATFIINLSDGGNITVPIDCAWFFNGSYGGHTVNSIMCGGSFSISRN